MVTSQGVYWEPCRLFDIACQTKPVPVKRFQPDLTPGGATLWDQPPEPE